MHRFLTILVLSIIALPSAVFAHATPVEMSPGSGENNTFVSEVSIRFSERLETGSSRIKVSDQSQTNVAEGTAVVGEDLYTLTVPVTTRDGVYVVSWSVVSQDDGHFTKGSYAFSVGSSTVAASSDSSMVKIATYPEVIALFFEFLGNSIFLGLLAFYFIFRNKLVTPDVAAAIPILKKYSLYLVVFGAVSALAGGITQFILKSQELALLHETFFLDAVHLYSHTAAGESTIVRICALFFFGAVFLFFRNRFFTRLNFVHVLLFAALLVFATARALISHAMANPFYPYVSIGINVFHLLEKDMWLGVTLVTAALSLTGFRHRLSEWIPRIVRFLTVNFAALSVTAGYIIWLHLKSFSNITTTEWGAVFIKLLSAALILVAVHVYHVVALKRRPDILARWFPFTIAAEAAAASLVVFFTSLVIITSPPSHAPTAQILTATEEGVVIQLERSPFEDASMLLTTSGSTKKPVVMIGAADGGLLVELQKRFEGGYVFPRALVEGKETEIHITAPHDGGYDARTTFSISPETFRTPEGHGRSFDFFTLTIILLCTAAILFAGFLYQFGRGHVSVEVIRGTLFAPLVSAVIVLLVVLSVQKTGGALFNNDFKEKCLADLNMWHLMTPLKAGVNVSGIASEGCMLGGGNYHYADAREYEYLRSLAPAEVKLTTVPAVVSADVPTRISFSLSEADGSPAQLAIEHERLLHVIVISSDMSYFAHVHPEEEALNAQSQFSLTHTFPKSGTYLISIDYLHGIQHESRQFRVAVEGGSSLSDTPIRIASPAKFGGYDVAMEYVAPLIGEVASLRYTIRKEGKPVVDMIPYLGAAMHVAIVKNDLSKFIHTHGEVHPPGYVAPPTVSHIHAPPPARFGPLVEAHLVFPESGEYSIFGEFRDASGVVIPTHFTIRVEK